jgi:hypothetical protein
MPDQTNTQGDTTQTNQEQNTTNQGAMPESWDKFLEAQPEEIKGLYTSHTAGLKSALDSERKARTEAEKSLRDLAKKAEAGSDAQKALTEQADKLNALEKQAAFQDKAHAAGVRNLKLAFMAAQQADMIDGKGNCDFAALKTEYPELFLSPPQGNAGNGTGATNVPSNMDAMIRQKAGRR